MVYTPSIELVRECPPLRDCVVASKFNWLIKADGVRSPLPVERIASTLREISRSCVNVQAKIIRVYGELGFYML
jgi:hypothetical protein